MKGEEIILIAANHSHTKPYFGGVYSCDTIPQPSSSTQFFIVNTDLLSGKGKHWVMVFINSHSKLYEWFDPLGNPPSHYNSFLQNFMTKNGNNSFLSNTFPVQSRDSDKCGYFCLVMADLRVQGVSFEDSLSYFYSDDIDRNDPIVTLYVDEHMKKMWY